MTVSATSTFQFSIGDICKMAYRNARLINENQGVSDVKGQVARDALQMVVNASQAKGLFARVVEFFNVTLVTGTYAYTLPNTVLDVQGDGMFIPAGQSLTAPTSTTPVAIMQRDDWNNQTNKATLSRPTRYYPHRTADLIEVRLWPTPSTSESGATVVFQTHRFRADVRDANATVDYERYWTQYLVYALAAELSRQNSMPMDQIQELKASAKEALEECKAMAKQRGPQQFTVNCDTGWSGR